MQNVYTGKSTQSFIDQMIDKGYELVQLREGVCGLGDLVLLSNDEQKYNFVIREVYLNEWSSGHTMRKAAKISVALQAEIDKANETEGEQKE
jgi:hypothetical protein